MIRLFWLIISFSGLKIGSGNSQLNDIHSAVIDCFHNCPRECLQTCFNSMDVKECCFWMQKYCHNFDETTIKDFIKFLQNEPVYRTDNEPSESPDVGTWAEGDLSDLVNRYGFLIGKRTDEVMQPLSTDYDTEPYERNQRVALRSTMRLGKRSGLGATMRLGKRESGLGSTMRLGKRDGSGLGTTMRLGKRDGLDTGSMGSTMRLGKRDMSSTMRLGKRDMVSTMRLGKRDMDSTMRLGKRNMDSTMRLGKRDMESTMRLGKRGDNFGATLRLGKRASSSDPDATPTMRLGKRYMTEDSFRLGKRVNLDSLRLGKRGPMADQRFGKRTQISTGATESSEAEAEGLQNLINLLPSYVHSLEPHQASSKELTLLPSMLNEELDNIVRLR